MSLIVQIKNDSKCYEIISRTDGFVFINEITRGTGMAQEEKQVVVPVVLLRTYFSINKEDSDNDSQ